MAVIEGYQYMGQGKTYSFPQLTAPGSTDVIRVSGCKNFIYQYTVASIDTNVVVRAEGSLDNSNWINLDVDNADTTVTTNSTDGFHYDGDGELSYARFRFISESGGTAATIDVIIKIGGTAS